MFLLSLEENILKGAEEIELYFLIVIISYLNVPFNWFGIHMQLVQWECV